MIACDYCGSEAMLVDGTVIYSHRSDLHHLRFWQCKPCDAWVGCHKETDKPLGRLADRELREAKRGAHIAFDELWKRTTPAGSFDRSGAYKWLAKQLGITREQCHIGLFDLNTCRKVVELCERRNGR